VIGGLPDLGGATRLVLVRHAEPDEPELGRVCGHTDVLLGPAGRRRAAALARALAAVPLAAVYASPLARALETARPVAAAHGLEPVVRPELRELDFGEVDGLRFEEIEAGFPKLVRAWADAPESVRFPGGESLADLRARALPAALAIRDAHPGGSAVVVAHAGVIRVVLADALGLPDGALFRLDQAHGGVSVVDWLDGTPLVRVVNASLGL
jgi:broad specificity phosphatase PhoE